MGAKIPHRRARVMESRFMGKMAGVTGLEPAASGVTGRRSNQLSYTPLRGSFSAAPQGPVRERARYVVQPPNRCQERSADIFQFDENRRKPGPSPLPRRPVSGRHATRIPLASAKKVSSWIIVEGWWAVTGSNRRPSGCKPDALPTELTARFPTGTAPLFKARQRPAQDGNAPCPPRRPPESNRPPINRRPICRRILYGWDAGS